MPELTEEQQLIDVAERVLAELGIDVDLSGMDEVEQQEFFQSLESEVVAALDAALSEEFPDLEPEFQPMEPAMAIPGLGALGAAARGATAFARAGAVAARTGQLAGWGFGALRGAGSAVAGAIRGQLSPTRLQHVGRVGSGRLEWSYARDAAGRMVAGPMQQTGRYAGRVRWQYPYEVASVARGRTAAGLGAAAEKVWDAGTFIGRTALAHQTLPRRWRIMLTALPGFAAAAGLVGALTDEEEEELVAEGEPIPYQPPEDVDMGQVTGAGPSGVPVTVNELTWQNHTVDSANDKYMNWLMGRSVALGTEMRDYGTLDAFLRAEGVQTVDMFVPQNREVLFDYLRTNWHKFERLQNTVSATANRRMDEFGEVAPPGSGFYQDRVLPIDWRGPDNPAPPEDVTALQEILGAGAGPRIMAAVGSPEGANQFSQIVNTFGEEGAGSIMAGVLDDAVNEYIDGYTGNRYMMVLPGAEGVTGAITNFVEQSFDGTPGGSVYSLRDLHSGPVGELVGPVHVPDYLRRKESETKVPGQGSPFIAQLQQSLYAMGMFIDDRGSELLPDEWGYVDDLTIRALQEFQWDVIVNYREAERMGLVPDVNKIYEEMGNQAVRRQRPESVKDAESEFKRRTVAEVRDGIDSALFERGVSLRSSSDAYINAVSSVLDGMTKAEEEMAFGEGSTPEEVTAASGLLKAFYGGGDNWADNIEFGHSAGNMNFINYANKVGALSQDEKDSLFEFRGSPDRYLQLRARLGKDVAVANFLSYLDVPLAEATREQVRNAVVMYGNTIGLGYTGRNGIDSKTLKTTADRGYDSMSFAPAEGVEQLLDTMEGRVANAMNVQGRGIGGARYSNLLNVMEAAMLKTRRSTTRNV
jgi:hypothetical protein